MDSAVEACARGLMGVVLMGVFWLQGFIILSMVALSDVTRLNWESNHLIYAQHFQPHSATALQLAGRICSDKYRSSGQ